MRIALILGLCSLLLAPASARAQEELRVQGVLRENTRWGGTVRLVGDVTVAKDVRLDIAPGTRIVISSKADPRGGWNDGLVELHVHGQVVADGHLSAPIRFTPQVWIEKAPKTLPDVADQPWLGIVFHPDATRGSELRGCVFHGGMAAVQAGAPGLVVRDCVFYRCSTGVQAGALWAAPRREGPSLRTSAPLIQRCRFGECFAGVTVEGAGRPEIERCVFFRCFMGVGNDREGLTYSVRGLGPFVDRSLFLSCSIGILGASRLTNSMFVGNRTALRSSAFQRKYSAVTDRVVRSHNLYHQNESIAVGDTPIGDAAILADPGFLRALPRSASILALAADLKHTFQVRPGSPTLAAATDGGGLGPAGELGALRPWDLAHDPGTSLWIDRWLVAGPPSDTGLSVDAAVARKLHERAPKPGRSVGDQTWAVFDQVRDVPGAASSVLAEGAPEPRVALAFFRAERDTTALLMLGLDGIARAWWNGESLPLPGTRRRYDPEDLRAPVAVRKGRNDLLLQLEPRGAQRRFHCRLVRSGDPKQAPEGVRLDDEGYVMARSRSGAPRLSIESARVRREKGASTFSLGVKLSGRVHWADVHRPRRLLVLETAGGSDVSLADLPVEYKPGTRFVRIRGIGLRDDVSYTVRLVGARAPDGRSLETEDGAVRVEVR